MPTIMTALGTAPIRKNGRHNAARGMVPIEKNIVVVDEQGTVFEPTWPKRANGLVKKGRARWLDEKTICLACPPEQMEDNEMENIKQTENVTEPIAEAAETKVSELTEESLLK